MPLATSKDPPQGYITVQDALDTPVGQLVNIIGVVVDFWPPKQSRGTDMQVTFFLSDNSQAGSIKIKWFWRPFGPSNEPRVQGIGDVVILQNIRILEHGFEKVATSNHASGCSVFPAKKIPAPHFNDEFASGAKALPHESTCRARKPTAAEQLYVITLHQPPQEAGAPEATKPFASSTTTESRAMMPPPPPQTTTASTPIFYSKKEKFRLIKDCEEMNFYDMAVEVVKIHPNSIDRVEIYVTDYTEHPLLFPYGEEKGNVDGDPYNYTAPSLANWQGPMGKRTMQVMLFEPHASACIREINVNDFVFLRNVHVKRDMWGTKLEGALHQDYKFSKRVDIIKPRVFDNRMTELQTRRKQYWESVKKPETDEPKVSRTDKKKKSKQAKKERQAQQKAEEAKKQKEAKESDHSANGCNGHVATERVVTSATRLADILDNGHYKQETASGVTFQAPFINAKFYTQVRVVDFWPDKLEDFAHWLGDETYCNVPPDTQSTGLSQDQKGWEWAFYLMVEDADTKQAEGDAATAASEPTRIAILVADKDAEYLLNLSASNLKEDPLALNQLREKLFVLWGNLEELKANGRDPWDDATREEHTSKSFGCFVKQYGVEDSSEPLGYRRMFRMFGTNIK
ncbi:uncharacterized protein J3D65DRAFT_640076 [Phyllosticta citribraziliensis]|uniref:Protection of telomeres protein 1 n=1 Tax=Phyllosticta citribraziliensis TaxID=989973 RepID=A0ABR1L6U6_9PEZI